MEELSRQLGENLPIAMRAAREATGKTSAELIKAIESGKILPQDFMMPFAKSLRSIVRENGALDASTKKVAASWERLKLAMQSGISNLFEEGGLGTGLKDLMDGVTWLIKVGLPGIQSALKPILTVFHEMANQIRFMAGFVDGFTSKDVATKGEGEEAPGRGSSLLKALLRRPSMMSVRSIVEARNANSTPTTNNNSKIDITINGATDPEAVGREVERVIQGQYNTVY